MPNTNRLSKGCKVEGKVGPLGEAPDGGKRRQRTVLTGWIIGSGEKQNESAANLRSSGKQIEV